MNSRLVEATRPYEERKGETGEREEEEDRGGRKKRHYKKKEESGVLAHTLMSAAGG